MLVRKLPRNRVLNLLRTKVNKGQFFGVRFIKRTDGEERSMNCRLGVISKLKGGNLNYNREAKGLIGVFDVDRQEYKNIPLEGIISMSVAGERFEIDG